VGCTLLAGTRGESAPRARPLSAIAFNDNRTSAGELSAGVLAVTLVARPGEWRPYGADSAGITMLAFGESGKPLQDPGPLLRMTLGTRLRVRVQNLTVTRLVVHGLSARRTAIMDSLVVAPGSSRIAEFTADVDGTFYYWASAHGEDFGHRELDDAHLDGALIVTLPGAPSRRNERIFVVELNTPDTLKDGTADYDHMLFSMNGRPWPNTERLSYDVGDSVHWRIINASADVHPFHLHGFFYRVDARGDMQRDTSYWPAQQRHVVTEPMWDGSTMDMAWSPDRPGGWIFHCHFNFHVVPNARLVPDTEASPDRERHLASGYPDAPGSTQMQMGMGGLVLGIYVRPPAGWKPNVGARRDLRLLVESDSTPGDSNRGYRYQLDDGTGTTNRSTLRAPGPPIVLHRGEPTRIWVINRTPDMTQVHWHGLEIESQYDGVTGVSGTPAAMEPGIMPGDSLAVLVTPPRVGSFMYHTHVNDVHQQTNGLYGPLIVVDSGTTWNGAQDQVFMVGDNAALAPVLNGGGTPAPLVLKAGQDARFRLMNITVIDPDMQFLLVHDGAVMQWTPVAKDAWPTPAWQRHPFDARQAVNIGETFDFLVTPADTGSMVLELRHLNGALVARQPIRVIK
jgi:FtsP/CotA-like multicopper oxidase with cupredoxin domain